MSCKVVLISLAAQPARSVQVGLLTTRIEATLSAQNAGIEHRIDLMSLLLGSPTRLHPAASADESTAIRVILIFAVKLGVA